MHNNAFKIELQASIEDDVKRSRRLAIIFCCLSLALAILMDIDRQAAFEFLFLCAVEMFFWAAIIWNFRNFWRGRQALLRLREWNGNSASD